MGKSFGLGKGQYGKKKYGSVTHIARLLREMAKKGRNLCGRLNGVM